jgi:glycolate oxidase FAD binding subunit
MVATDDSERLIEAVRRAAAEAQPLVITGSGSKRFLGRAVDGAALSTAEHQGIVAYQPAELVVTARAGTPLDELRQVLTAERQMLPFDPPTFADMGTFGGAIAAGLAGPGRPWHGAVRDAVLGVELVNGRGERLRFGGQVMKNVAGFDVSRLMAGACGTLGVLLAISVRVVPQPELEITRVFELDRDAARARTLDLARQPEPVTATCHIKDRLYLRLSGSAAGVESAARRLGGSDDPEQGAIWAAVRDHRHPALELPSLWRFSVPASAPYPFDADWVTEWGGRQRWASVALPAAQIWRVAAALGGHAVCYAHGDGGGDAFAPLDDAALAYHRRLKRAFDPAGILNPGRLYAEL